MLNLSKRSKRFLACMIAFLFIFGQFATPAATYADDDFDFQVYEEAEDEFVEDAFEIEDDFEVVEDEVFDEDFEEDFEILDTDEEEVEAAAANGVTALAFTSDVHNGTASGGETNVSALRMATWLSKVQPYYNNDIKVMGFCGDMAAASSNSSTFWTFTQTAMEKLDAYNMTGVYAVGNHEYMNGSFDSTSNSPEVRNKYKLNAEGRAVAGENYVMYCLGTNSSHGYSWSYDADQVTALKNYLNSVSNDKVIIILTHFPLHVYGSRTTGNAINVLNAVNDAALGSDGRYGTSDDKKIVFLWGHNHTEGDTNYDEIFAPGSQINDSAKSTVYFYYAAAGSMADAEYGQSAKILGKGLVMTIDSQNMLSFTYYDANGNNVTEPDGTTFSEAPQEPVAISGVTISNSNLTVKAGKTLQLKYTTNPSNATVESVSWSSSNKNVATVDDNGKVTGVATGNATITLTISDGLSRNVVTTSTEITVAEAGVSEEHTVSITPSTSNPEETIHIEVGDTLVINTTNGSSNSAYDFTATLSKSGVVEFQGSSSANIAAGASAAFTVEGMADGTVDITIQNSNQYGSSYVRKGIIHVTVGEGGDTPVDPPVGDTVNITPSTDNPEESIKIAVGDTLTINVTNGSSNSAYDFTASLSKSGVVTNAGSSSQNIAAGANAAFTFTGVADGTVDITIQNSNQYGSQYVRKGIIHVTVGEGGDTPVDPPTGDEVSITPTTDNPEESIKIAVDDVLTINVKNGSSNSAYDFTASLSGTGVAELQGDTTKNIAAGATAEFYVKGLKEGTVDITIQNENSYGSQYVRKGVVHLTVGEGGTPVDPGANVTYVLTNTIESGKEYLIATGNSGSVYLVSNQANGSKTLKGVSATVSDSKITITEADAAKTAFTVEANTNSSQNGIWLKNGSQYLYADSSDGLRMVAESTQTSSSNNAKSWHYKADDKNLLWFFKDTSSADGYTDTSSTYKYYLDPSSGNFTDAHVSTTSLANTTTPAIYLYVRDDSSTPTTIPVTGVSLDKSSATMTTGDTITLTATVAPSNATNKAVTWTSSNTSAATVANGVVTAVAAGTATITVKTSDGNYTATCAVTVKDPDPGADVTYVLTDELESGKEYLIATGNSGSVYIVSNEANGSKTLKGVSVTVSDSKITITQADAENTAFTVEANRNSSQNGLWLKNGSQYLYADSSNGLRMVADSTQTSSSNNAKSWHYKADDKNLLWFFKDTSSSDGYTDTSSTYKYYLDPSSGNFTDAHVSTTSLANTTTPAIYLFVKDDGSSPQPHTHTYGNPTWSWTGNDASGYTAAVATFTCTAGDDTQNITATVTSSTSGSTTTYTATATFNGRSYTDTKTVTAGVVTYTFTGFTWNGTDASGYTAVANFNGSDGSSRTVNATISKSETAASCETAGSTVYTARVTASQSLDSAAHSATKTVEIEALGHNFGDWTEVSAATCTAKGEEKRTCSRCQETETREIEMLDHDIEIIPAVAATCTSAGLTEGQKCKVCGTILVVQKEAEALGHNLEAHAAKSATCTEPGNSTYWSCTRCGKFFGNAAGTSIIEEEECLIPATGHDWGVISYTWADDNSTVTAKRVCKNDATHIETEDGVVTAKVTKEATCEEKGETTYSAVFTNEAFAVQPKTVANIESTGHKLEKVEAKVATCKETGNTEYWTCSACGKYFSDADGKNEIKENSWVIAKADHTFGDWEVKTAATCIKKGVETRTCSVCGEVESRETKLAGHVLTKTAAKDATCTKDGNSTYYTCDTCGKYFSDSKGKKEIEKDSWVIEKLGHDYGEYIVTKKASGVNSGILTSTCSRCSKTKTKVVNPCLVKVTSSKGTEATITWNKVNGAGRYQIYFVDCGVEELEKVATINSSAAGSYTQSGLTAGKFYRCQIVAQQKVTVDGKKTWKTIATSYTAHFVSGNQNAKKVYTNVKSISVTSGTDVAVKVGKTSTIKATVTLVKPDLKMLNTSHAAKFRYASSNSAIATVDKSGVITGVKAGSCKIYVIGVNGVYKTITVTVS